MLQNPSYEIFSVPLKSHGLKKTHTKTQTPPAIPEVRVGEQSRCVFQLARASASDCSSGQRVAKMAVKNHTRDELFNLCASREGEENQAYDTSVNKSCSNVRKLSSSSCLMFVFSVLCIGV